jgi:hypothetical protein
MTGNYLTTTGRDSKLDQEMIADLGLIPTREANHCKCGAGEENSCLSPRKVKRKSVKAKIAAKRPQKE